MAQAVFHTSKYCLYFTLWGAFSERMAHNRVKAHTTHSPQWIVVRLYLQWCIVVFSLKRSNACFILSLFHALLLAIILYIDASSFKNTIWYLVIILWVSISNTFFSYSLYFYDNAIFFSARRSSMARFLSFYWLTACFSLRSSSSRAGISSELILNELSL